MEDARRLKCCFWCHVSCWTDLRTRNESFGIRISEHSVGWCFRLKPKTAEHWEITSTQIQHIRVARGVSSEPAIMETKPAVSLEPGFAMLVYFPVFTQFWNCHWESLCISEHRLLFSGIRKRKHTCEGQWTIGFHVWLHLETPEPCCSVE